MGTAQIQYVYSFEMLLNLEVAIIGRLQVADGKQISDLSNYKICTWISRFITPW